MAPGRTASLAGLTALVTGAGRGLGRACALGLARAGASVIAVARTPEDLHEVRTEAGSGVTAWCEDVTSESFHQRVEQLSTLHILVNNAGYNKPAPVESVDVATLDGMLDLNVRALYRTSQAAIRVMLRNGAGGSIVHMSSQMGHVGASARSVYCMTKHAVGGLTKALAVELAPRGIRVNSVAPTFIETDMTRPRFADPAFRQSVVDSSPMGRYTEDRKSSYGNDLVAGAAFTREDASLNRVTWRGALDY